MCRLAVTHVFSIVFPTWTARFIIEKAYLSLISAGNATGSRVHRAWRALHIWLKTFARFTSTDTHVEIRKVP
jgi:hypothetical protein